MSQPKVTLKTGLTLYAQKAGGPAGGLDRYQLVDERGRQWELGYVQGGEVYAESSRAGKNIPRGKVRAAVAALYPEKKLESSEGEQTAKERPQAPAISTHRPDPTSRLSGSGFTHGTPYSESTDE